MGQGRRDGGGGSGWAQYVRSREGVRAALCCDALCKRRRCGVVMLLCDRGQKQHSNDQRRRLPTQLVDCDTAQRIDQRLKQSALSLWRLLNSEFVQTGQWAKANVPALNRLFHIALSAKQGANDRDREGLACSAQPQVAWRPAADEGRQQQRDELSSLTLIEPLAFSIVSPYPRAAHLRRAATQTATVPRSVHLDRHRPARPRRQRRPILRAAAAAAAHRRLAKTRPHGCPPLHYIHGLLYAACEVHLCDHDATSTNDIPISAAVIDASVVQPHRLLSACR